MKTLTKETEKGKEFLGPTKNPTFDRTRAFSGWPKKNVHTDVDFAKSCGFPAPVASGAMLQGYISEMMLGLFGDEWLYHGKMSVTFVKPVFAGDTVSIRAKVISKTNKDSKTRFELNVWGYNQHGEKVFVGDCFGLVP